MPSKSANVKNKDQYEALKDKGMSKERAAKIANSPKASEHGGRKSHSGGSRDDRLREAFLLGGPDPPAAHGGGRSRPIRAVCAVLVVRVRPGHTSDGQSHDRSGCDARGFRPGLGTSRAVRSAAGIVAGL